MLRRIGVNFALFVSLCCFYSVTSLALPFTLTFSASNFGVVAGSDPVPVDPVTGSLVYEASSAAAQITGINSINLTIAGHTYTLAEVGFVSTPSSNLVGGLINGPSSVAVSGPDDFFITWEIDGGSFVNFAYHVAGVDSTFITQTGQTVITPVVTAVTAPAPLFLLIAGLTGLSFCRRKRLQC